MSDVRYLHMRPDDPIAAAIAPDAPYAAVIVVEADVTPDWRDAVSVWLVRTGCLYAMAWGRECSLWDDAVDDANLAAFDWGPIPEDKFVMTTWHDDEPLEGVFWFAVHAAKHGAGALERMLILHVASAPSEPRLLAAYADGANQ